MPVRFSHKNVDRASMIYTYEDVESGDALWVRLTLAGKYLAGKTTGAAGATDRAADVIIDSLLPYATRHGGEVNDPDLGASLGRLARRPAALAHRQRR